MCEGNSVDESSVTPGEQELGVLRTIRRRCCYFESNATSQGRGRRRRRAGRGGRSWEILLLQVLRYFPEARAEEEEG